jgi:hypothetical protein
MIVRPSFMSGPAGRLARRAGAVTGMLTLKRPGEIIKDIRRLRLLS